MGTHRVLTVVLAILLGLAPLAAHAAGELFDTKAAGQQIVARVEPMVKTRSHEKIRLSFIPDRIHFFDAKTEAVIG